MFTKGKIGSYLLYALGEIILVVLGILIALQINNVNEDCKSKKQLNTILKTVSYDLATDTLVVNGILAYYDQHKKDSKRIINRELNLENYRECPGCVALTSIYQPFPIQTKGYELLKNFAAQHTLHKDTLVTDITQVYTLFVKLIEDNNDLIREDALQNLESFKEHSWFVDLTQNKPTPEMITYFTQSEDYRKRVAAHSILAYQNHVLTLNRYKTNAAELLRLINERVKEEEND